MTRTRIISPTAERLPQNLLANSEDLSADWSTDGVTVDTDVVADPILGATTMDRINVTAETNEHRLYRAFAFEGGVTHTLSIYAKDDGGRYCSIGFNAGANDYVAVVCDLQLGTVTLEKEGVSNGTITNTSIEEITTGIYRITLSGSVVGVGAQLRIAVHSSGTPTLGAWQDESFLAVAGEDVIVWGAQFENYSTAGVYTKTTSAAIPGGNRVLTRLPQNLLLQSEDLSTSWVNSNTTEDTTGVSDPFGTSKADKLVEAATSSTHYITQTISGLTDGASYTFSVYLKAGERGWALIYLGAIGVGIYVDLSSGEFGSTFIGAPTALSISDEGDGWYRVTITGATSGGTTCDPRIYTATADNTSNYLGDVTKGIYVFGAQFEAHGDGLPGTYTATTTAKVPGVTINRASTATYFDHNGILQTAAIGEDRTDYDPSDNSLRGLLIEEARTNIWKYSEIYNEGDWSNQGGITVTINDTTAPDGTTSMDEVSTDGVGTQYIFQDNTVADDSKSWTLSYWIKKTTGKTTFPGLQLDLTGGTQVTSAWMVNTNDGTLEARSINAGTVSATIADAGDYWYVTQTLTNNSTGNVTARTYFFPDAGSTSTWVYTNAGAMHLWGVQVEKGSAASSYIPTTAASVTRAADDIFITDLSAIGYDAAKGSMFAEFEYQKDFAGADYESPFSFSDGTEANRIEQYRLSATNMTRLIQDTTVQVNGGRSISGNGPHLTAQAWEENNDGFSVNGGAAVSDTSCTIPTVTALEIGAGSIGYAQILEGWLKQLDYYNKRLSDDDLVLLSGGGDLPFPRTRMSIKIGIGIY